MKPNAFSMGNQYTSIHLKKALGNQNYLILDDKYRQQLANHPLVRNLWTIGDFFVIVANIFSFKTELACGKCEAVSGFSVEEIEAGQAEFLFNFVLQEDLPFNMASTKLGIEYYASRAGDERDLIFVVYFYRAKRKDGKVVTIQHQAIPLYFDENKMPFIISNIITDVSYLGITNVPHALLINRFTDEVFHIEPHNIKLSKVENLFSIREREIIKLLFQGQNSRHIGEHLAISKETVRTHRKNILRKASLNTTSQLLSYAMMHGIV
jgi:DNA-binding CsgD family transcriptional regulator